VSAARVLLTGVSKTLGRRRVLDDVALDVAPGTTTVVLGASGAGKSTLLRLIAGLADADEGRIEIDGDVVADPRSRVPAERRGVGMVFQALELFPHLDVAENVAFGLPGRPHGAAAARDARVREVLEGVGLPEALWRRRPALLSGGERQRAAIARALAPRPRVLLYDEPLANLDPGRRAELRALVRRLAREAATTVIYVTHDAAEALELGDEIVVLDAGRVVDHGAPETLRASPRCLASARALGPVSVVATDAASTRRLLGADAPPDAGRAPGSGGRLVLRPEHVVTAGSGAAGVVVDAYPAGDRYAFEARLDGGETLRGLSPSRLVAGATVHLRIVGSPGTLVADPTGSDT